MTFTLSLFPISLQEKENNTLSNSWNMIFNKFQICSISIPEPDHTNLPVILA